MKTITSNFVVPTIRLGCVCLTMLALAVTKSTGGETASHFEMTTYSQPGAVSTAFHDINNDGTIVGSSTAQGMGQLPKGLIVQRGHGVSVELPDPGYVRLIGVRANGWALGEYDAEDFSVVYGFLRSPRGVITPLSDAGMNVHQVLPAGINDRGHVVGGAFGEFNGEFGGKAFILKRGAYSFYAYPATNLAYMYFMGVNNAGRIVGTWSDTDNNSHAFKFHKGQFTDFSVPGADATYPVSINNRGQVAGFYIIGMATYGFLEDKGDITTFDYQNLGTTAVYGLNERGVMVGTTTTTNGEQGLIIKPKRGRD